MYKVDIPLDTKESAAIQARQNKEAARKSRIFDARQRTGNYKRFLLLQTIVIFSMIFKFVV